jgi:hypothetical protein
MPGGLPFGAVKLKTGDWAKYRMMMGGAMTQTAVEIDFGGTSYEGNEIVMDFSGAPGMPAMPTMPAMPPGMPSIPGMPIGPSVSVYLTEKGRANGKTWVVTKTGTQVQCSGLGAIGAPGQPTPAPNDPGEFIKPDMTLLGTDTYKVPETGQTIKVWKYSGKATVEGQTVEHEAWFSDKVPTYSVKVVSDNPATPGTKMTVMELLGFGSGAKVAITAAELAANCK